MCGDWVRIFPFDAITDECAKFDVDEDMKKSVTQVCGLRKSLNCVVYKY